MKEEQQNMTYEEANVDERIKRAVKELGFEYMTPIQSQAIPKMLEGIDLIGQAQTGTGKTAAFGIPAIELVEADGPQQALILCPTRELAIQAAAELRNFAKYVHGIKVLPIYGGQDISRQIRSLKSKVQIIVGTPGRVMDHMKRKTIKTDDIRLLVLDEADEMLNMGFREDIEKVCSKLPEDRQTVLFSATMPQAILDITSKYQHDAVILKMPAKEVTIPLVKQYYYEVKRQNKEEVTCRLIDYYNPKRSLIFCNTKRMVDDLAESLQGRGYFAEGLHGDLSQKQRDQVMNRFRSGKCDILIATDVAARGIDVNDVEAVFNYDIPQDIEYYVHRIGRTGRAGKKGRSFTLVVGREIYKIRDIERSCKTKMKARVVPSAADVTSIKADKIFNQILDVIKEGDLAPMLRLVEGRLNEEDCTAMELAAAFLKHQMGDELEEIPTEDFFAQKKKGGKRQYSDGGKRFGDKRSSGGRRYGDNGGKRYGDNGKRFGDNNKKHKKSGVGERYGKFDKKGNLEYFDKDMKSKKKKKKSKDKED